MNMLEFFNKPITRIGVVSFLFLVTTLLFGNSLEKSIENILLSRVQVHSQSQSFALSPMLRQKHMDNFDRYSLVEASIDEKEGSVLSATGRIVTSDARQTALRQFLLDYNSPMYPYAHVFVEEADKYGLDWRLAAAISGVESAFGTIPVRANNAWGWKGGADGDFNPFDTWEDGIETVTRRLALGYGVDMDPFDIEPIYCPPCGENPASLWANGVVKFMNEIDMYLKGF